MEYRSATLSGPGLELTLSNRGSAGPTDSILVDVVGFYGGVGVDGDNTKRPLGHGLFVTPSTRTGRVLTLKGVLVHEDEATRDLAARVLSGILWDGELGTLAVDVGGLELSAEVKLDGEVKHAYLGPNAHSIEIPLIAPDPFLRGEEQLIQLFPAGYGEGLEWDLFEGSNLIRHGFPTWPTANAGKGTPAPGAPDIPSALFTGTAAVQTSSSTAVDMGTGTYTVRGWVRANGSATTTMAIVARYYGPTGAAMSPASTNYYLNNVSTSWTYWEQELTLPAGTARLHLQIYPNHANGTTRDATSYDVALEHARAPFALAYGASVPSSSIVVRNGGNAEAWPRVVVRGDFPQGFRLTAGTQTIEYGAPTHAASPVLIDMATSAVLVDGRDQATQLRRRGFFSIPPGEAIQPRLSGIEQGNGWADVIHCDTYI